MIITFTNLFSSTRFARNRMAYSAPRVDSLTTAKIRRGGDFYDRFAY